MKKNYLLIIFTLCYFPVFVIWIALKYFFGSLYGITILDEIFNPSLTNELNKKYNKKTKKYY